MLPAGALTIRPGGLGAPVVSVGELPTTKKPEQLVSATTIAASEDQQPRTISPRPILAKTSKFVQPDTSVGIQPEVASTQADKNLPRLPPAKLKKETPQPTEKKGSNEYQKIESKQPIQSGDSSTTTEQIIKKPSKPVKLSIIPGTLPENKSKSFLIDEMDIKSNMIEKKEKKEEKKLPQ